MLTLTNSNAWKCNFCNTSLQIVLTPADFHPKLRANWGVFRAESL